MVTFKEIYLKHGAAYHYGALFMSKFNSCKSNDKHVNRITLTRIELGKK